MRFVGDIEHPILASVLGAVFDKVVGPDIVALLRPQRMHEPSASQSLPRLRCSWGTFSPSRCQIRSTRLSLIIQPAWRRARRHNDLWPGKLDNIGCETRCSSSRPSMLPERRTGATLGDMQLRSDLGPAHAGTATRAA